jgi:hypothetical protein
MKNLNETGKLLRLIGPLFQLPSLWLLTQRPEYAARHMGLIYIFFIGGLGMVLTGLLFSLKLKRK